MADIETLYQVQASADGGSWLDMVPGARAAYNYVVGKLAEFHVIGLQRLPGYEKFLAAMGGRLQASSDPALVNLYTQAVTQTGQLRAKFAELEPQVRALAAKLSGGGLGAVPLAVLLTVAAGLVTLAAGMYVFFGADAQNEDTVRQLVDRAVANGVMTAADATRLLRSGGGSGLGSLGTGLTTLALVAAAVYFLPRSRRA